MSNVISAARLLKAAIVLEEDAVKRGLDSDFSIKSWPRCAAAILDKSKAFRPEGFYYLEGAPYYSGERAFNALMKFFGITYDEVLGLFHDTSMEDGAAGKRALAARIRAKVSTLV